MLERAEEFKLNHEAGERKWFIELSLCILTANSSFEAAYRSLQIALPAILRGDEEEIKRSLVLSGYRFPNLKAKYLALAAKRFANLKGWIKPIADRDQFAAREELLGIEGIGMKEASHFLRNVGYMQLAIIDRHVIRFIEKIGGPSTPKLSLRLYLYLEEIIRGISSSVGLPPGLLDLYIWYLETGTILK